MRFHNESSMRKFCTIVRERVELEQLGNIHLQVHEDNIKILSKFLARVNIGCTQWMKVQCRRVPDHCKISSHTVQEYDADFDTITASEREMAFPYKVLSFDIEVFSSVPNRFPVAMNANDKVFAISVVTESFNRGHPRGESRKRWCLSLGDASAILPLQAKDSDNETFPYKVVKFENEKELISGFARLVVEEDPDVVTGHNIWGFDIRS